MLNGTEEVSPILYPYRFLVAMPGAWQCLAEYPWMTRAPFRGIQGRWSLKKSTWASLPSGCPITPATPGRLF
jgi:hypothetical protein